MNSIARSLGFRLIDRGRGWRLMSRWAEITGRVGLSIDLMNWAEEENWSLHLHLIWPNMFIRLPLPRREPKDQISDQWGFSVSTDGWDSVHLHWGQRTKIVHAPWAWSFFRWSYLAKDGRSWLHELDSHRAGRDSIPVGQPQIDWFMHRDLPRWKKTLPYRYVLRSGVVQEREATIGVEEAEWRWRWFKWLAWPRKVRRSIDVTFNDEVGERSGSWKGGTLGCGYTMQHDETPEECLRRMESERKF